MMTRQAHAGPADAFVLGRSPAIWTGVALLVWLPGSTSAGQVAAYDRPPIDGPPIFRRHP